MLLIVQSVWLIFYSFSLYIVREHTVNLYNLALPIWPLNYTYFYSVCYRDGSFLMF